MSVQMRKATNGAVPKLLTTANYSMFQRSEFNRDVKNIDKLLSSMRQHGYIAAYPIHCVRADNGKLVIKAGHHRFDAAVKLGIPVFYIVCDDVATVAELERATTPWTMEAYVTSHARAGVASFIELLEFSQRTGISIGQSASMMSGESANSCNQFPKLKTGTFTVRTTEHADCVARIVTGLRSIGIRFCSQRTLVGALSMCVWLEQFNPDVFLHKVASTPGMFIKQSTRDQYLDLIEKLYNHNAKQKRIAIAFLAREAAKSRSATTKRSNASE